MNDTSKPRFDRPDDSGYNNPSKLPKKSRPLPEGESEQFDQTNDDLGLNDLLHADTATATPSPLTILENVHSFVRKSIFLLTLAVLIVGLVLYASALSFITDIAAYPIYLQWPLWLLLVLVLLLVLYALIRIIRIWRSLHAHPKVILSKADNSNNAKTQKDLIKYLTKLNVEKRQQVHNWTKFWPEDQNQVPTLVKSCSDLTRNRPMDADTWIEEFNERIINPIDQAANRRIRYYSKLVGIKTAVSPFPLIDSIAVLYNNFLMLGDLASLYGRKLSKQDLFLLLWINIFQVYIAGQSQELLESLADEMSQTIKSQIARSFTHFIAPKIAEGTINAMVTWRLGKQAMKIMHPLTI